MPACAVYADREGDLDFSQLNQRIDEMINKGENNDWTSSKAYR